LNLGKGTFIIKLKMVIEYTSDKLQASRLKNIVERKSNKHQAASLTSGVSWDNIGDMRKKIDNNNLIPWFMDDHDNLPKSYLESCQRFFLELDRRQSERRGKHAKNNHNIKSS